MKILLFIVSFFIHQIIIGQNIIFESSLYSKNTEEQIAFATISFTKSLSATTSDAQGQFKLVFNETILPDTIEIRHLSYETKKIYLTKEKLNSLAEIFLKEKNNDINEVIVKAKTAFQIIENVIKNLDNNYNNEVYSLEGFYRQFHKENNNYVRLIECFAVVKENISNRNDEKQKEAFLVNNIRRSNIYERNGDKHGDHFVDLFSENPINYTSSLFLNFKNIHNYSFSYLENKTEFIKIHFQNKAWQMQHNKSGYILINKTDFAIIEIEIISTKNNNRKEETKSNWKFQNGVYKAKYVKLKNKYYCKESSKYYNHYVLNEKTNSVEYLVEEYFNWFTFFFHNKEYTENINMKFVSMTNLYSKEYIYNIEDWKKIPKIDSSIISGLEKFKDLEIQFIDD